MSHQSRMASGESRTQQIARQIRTDIAAGKLRHGEALPSTRDLAQQWGVSTFTIAEAMRVLADEGLIRTQSRSRRTVYAPEQALNVEIRPARPHVVLIGGYAGSGKSELGRILTRETGWAILDKDTLTRAVVEMALEFAGQSPNDRESDTYLRQVRPREYEALAEAAQENVACGHSVILTAPFIREFADTAWVERTRAQFAALSAVTTLIWVYCDTETMHMYLRRRGAARDTTKLENWSTYLKSIDPAFRPQAPHLVINNSASSEPLIAQAKEALDTILTT